MSLWTISNICSFLLLIVQTTRKWYLNRDITKQVQVKAKMIVSEMNSKGHGSKHFRGRYEYQYLGRCYESEVNTLKIHDFHAFVKRHPVGSEIDIYISPSNPSFSSFSVPNPAYVLARIALPYFGVILFVNYVFAKSVS